MMHVNTRLDLITRTRHPKERLLRFVVVDGVVKVDIHQNMQGRGYYLLKADDTLALAKKKHTFERLLRRELTAEEHDALSEAMHE